MKTKELYTNNHNLDLSQENVEYPADYQEDMDKEIPKDWWKAQDEDLEAQKKFTEKLKKPF